MQVKPSRVSYILFGIVDEIDLNIVNFSNELLYDHLGFNDFISINNKFDSYQESKRWTMTKIWPKTIDSNI